MNAKREMRRTAESLMPRMPGIAAPAKAENARTGLSRVVAAR